MHGNEPRAPEARGLASLDARSRRLVVVVSFALAFEEYDQGLMTAALPRIAADLGVAEGELPLLLAAIRLGVIPAFFVIAVADRIGRRRAFLGATFVLGLLTLATAFAPNTATFVLLQALVRTFVVVGTSVALVIVAEELPAEHRGTGLGALTALSLVGHGVVAALFSQVDRLPHGWRDLYAFGVLPVLLYPLFLRLVPETRRFEAGRAMAALAPRSSVTALAREAPLRLLGTSAAGFFLALAMLPAFQLNGYFVQHVHGWSPTAYAAMILVAGGLGILGNVVAGRIADSLGRRRTGTLFLASFPFACGLFYLGPAASLWPAWILMLFTASGGRLIVRALATELFPTDRRGTATGFYTSVEMVGGGVGLLAVHAFGSVGDARLPELVTAVSTLVLVAGAIVARFPETSGVELEAIAPHEPASAGQRPVDDRA